MHYLELIFSPIISEEDKNWLIAELMVIEFESFSEEDNAVIAYISSEKFNKAMLKDVEFLKGHPVVNTRIKHLENKNWNKEWESNYQPVTIAGKCYVRAPFHPALRDAVYEIIIEPKMAFGTAHHETTQLMAGWLMDIDVSGKDVLDMGCGTGILAILANKMGAANVTGIDNDEWAWRNAMDNFRINGVPENNVFLGDAALIRQESFDLILANINRNVLLKDMKTYSLALRKDGMLLLSGFYHNDVEAITACASDFGLHLSGKRILNNWAVLLFYK